MCSFVEIPVGGKISSSANPDLRLKVLLSRDTILHNEFLFLLPNVPPFINVLALGINLCNRFQIHPTQTLSSIAPKSIISAGKGKHTRSTRVNRSLGSVPVRIQFRQPSFRPRALLQSCRTQPFRNQSLCQRPINLDKQRRINILFPLRIHKRNMSVSYELDTKARGREGETNLDVNLVI
jgi:hypothetical protein